MCDWKSILYLIIVIVLGLNLTIFSDYGYYGYYEPEETEPLPERTGWVCNFSVGSSIGEIGYGFKSPYIGFSFNLRRYLEEHQWMRFGFGTAYCRSSIFNERDANHPPVFNSSKDQFHISFMNDFFLLHDRRVSPWAGYGFGLFFMRASGKYQYMEKVYDEESMRWITVIDENRTLMEQSFMAGVMVNFGVRVIISERVDFEGYLSQTFGLATLKKRFVKEMKGDDKTYNVYRVPTAETVFFGGVVFGI